MIKHRAIKYFVLAIVSLLLPFLLTMLLVAVTGSRTSGMLYFPIPSVIVIHLFFALTQLKGRISKKVAYGIIAAISTTILTIIPIYFGIRLNLDSYGFWDLIIFFTLGTIGSWECLYQIDRKRNKTDLLQDS